MSKQISKLFLKIDQQVTEQINDEKNELDMENLTEKNHLSLNFLLVVEIKSSTIL